MAKISDDVGRAWEEAVGNKLEALKLLRVVAWWEHQQPDLFSLGVVRRGGRPIQAFGKGAPSGADFSGVLHDRRGAFALEAKSVGPKEGREPVLILEEAISPKQVEHLNAVAEAGDLAAIAVQFRRDRAPWLNAVIPWSVVPWEKAKTRHHLRAEACERWRIPTGTHLFEHLIPRL